MQRCLYFHPQQQIGQSDRDITASYSKISLQSSIFQKTAAPTTEENQTYEQCEHWKERKICWWFRDMEDAKLRGRKHETLFLGT